MNLRRPNANAATGTFNRSRSVVPTSGICADCVDGCKGGCEIWLSSFRVFALPCFYIIHA